MRRVSSQISSSCDSASFYKNIMREWDTPTSCKRRQSEPPTCARNLSKEKSRDEAYMRALTKFNEWRNKQRFGSFRRIKRRKSKKDTKTPTKDTFEENLSVGRERIDKNPEGDESNLYEEIIIQNNGEQSEIKDYITANDIRNKRHSMPNAIISSAHSKNIYDEKIKELKKQTKNSKRIITPPSKFYRNNSNPYQEIKSPVKICHKPKRLFNNNSPEPQNNNSVMVDHQCDHRVCCTNHYNGRNDKNRYSSPVYQTVVNRHGDLVEYALPYNDQNEGHTFDEFSHQSSPIYTQPLVSNYNRGTPLGDNVYYSDLNESYCHRSIANPMYYHEPQKHMIITDLDKSEAIPQYVTRPNDEILRELNSLEKWSMSINLSTEAKNIQHDLNFFKKYVENSNLVTCKPDQISHSTCTVQNTLNEPICFSSGTFRQTPVSVRKFGMQFKKQSEIVLLKDLFILSKIKHPNIVLLMAVGIEEDKTVSSLILEPFSCTINSLMYHSGKTISIEDCIDYTLQVANAVIYLHENGYVHSNISSHCVLVNESRKFVKLSSFELAIELKDNVGNEIMGKFVETNNYNNKISFISEDDSAIFPWNTQILSEYWSYLIEYRRMYSERFYQAPELLSTKNKLVFPIKQSDVYGLSLLLWEMLNTCVPYAIFSYEELENLFVLNEAYLPSFEAKRCELFEDIFMKGLVVSWTERIDNVQALKYLIKEAKMQLSTLESSSKSNSSYKSFKESPLKSISLHSSPNVNSNRMTGIDEENSQLHKNTLPSPDITDFQTEIIDKTSTIKRSKSLLTKYNDNSPKKQIQYVDNVCDDNITKRISNRIAHQSLSSSKSLDSLNDRSNEGTYEFKIDKISLPSTPIARTNKLRRTAWLSNKKFSQIHKNVVINEVPQEEDRFQNAAINNMSFSKNKHLNVNIKITQKKSDISIDEKQRPTSASSTASSNAVPHIQYWNSLYSPSSKSNTQTETSFEPKSLCNSTRSRSSLGDKSPNSISRKVIPEFLDGSFLKEISTPHKTDFESSLWKKEKERCETITPRKKLDANGVETPLRRSVRDTINKFESFSKKSKISPKSYKTNINDNFLNHTTDDKQLNNQENNNNDKPIQFVQNDLKISNIDNNENTKNPNISITKLDVTLENNLHENKCKKSIPSNRRKENENLNITNNEPSTSKQSKDTCKNQPTLFTVNLRKIDRRASDIGCPQRKNLNKNTNKAFRHSIGGTEILKNSGRLHFINNQTIIAAQSKIVNIIPDDSIIQQQNSLENLTNPVQTVKIVCWKCGSKVFRVDNNDEATDYPTNNGHFIGRFTNAPANFETSVSSDFFPTLSSFEEAPSTEDIYIDDDFYHHGANMELGTERCELFDILSIDILSTSPFDLSQSSAADSNPS